MLARVGANFQYADKGDDRSERKKHKERLPAHASIEIERHHEGSDDRAESIHGREEPYAALAAQRIGVRQAGDGDELQRTCGEPEKKHAYEERHLRLRKEDDCGGDELYGEHDAHALCLADVICPPAEQYGGEHVGEELESSKEPHGGHGQVERLTDAPEAGLVASRLKSVYEDDEEENDPEQITFVSGCETSFLHGHPPSPDRRVASIA